MRRGPVGAFDVMPAQREVRYMRDRRGVCVRRSSRPRRRFRSSPDIPAPRGTNFQAPTALKRDYSAVQAPTPPPPGSRLSSDASCSISSGL